MIRAVFFDFYSVWTPDKISYYLAIGQQNGPETYKQLCDVVEAYYHGKIDINFLADSFRVKLGHEDISSKIFLLQEKDISPQVINFMRGLHGHFLKLGILANLGIQEYKLLSDFNEHNQIFETIASPLSLQLNLPLMSREVFGKSLQAIGEPLDNSVLVSGNLALLEFASNLGMGVIQFEGFDKLQKTIDQLVNQDLSS
jgi:FMN phosphatase YigB (HAD superfamily)